MRFELAARRVHAAHGHHRAVGRVAAAGRRDFGVRRRWRLGRRRRALGRREAGAGARPARRTQSSSRDWPRCRDACVMLLDIDRLIGGDVAGATSLPVAANGRCSPPHSIRPRLCDTGGVGPALGDAEFEFIRHVVGENAGIVLGPTKRRAGAGPARAAAARARAALYREYCEHVRAGAARSWSVSSMPDDERHGVLPREPSLRRARGPDVPAADGAQRRRARRIRIWSAAARPARSRTRSR